MIIFANADISNINSSEVYDIDDALSFITKSIVDRNYSLQFIERVNRKLIDIKNRYGISIEKHVRNISGGSHLG